MARRQFLSLTKSVAWLPLLGTDTTDLRMLGVLHVLASACEPDLPMRARNAASG